MSPYLHSAFCFQICVKQMVKKIEILKIENKSYKSNVAFL